jgi:hypothetical protein
VSVEPEIAAAIERTGELQQITTAGPTARELVDVFGEDSLLVETPGGEVPGWVDAQGLVQPFGKWRVRIARPDLSPERNTLRLTIFNDMMQKRRAMQEADTQETHATTDHVLWKDRDGEARSAPAESADRNIERTGLAPMTHPKVWRPHG